MEFPEDFNQLELLDTHGHLIPRGPTSSWTASKDEEEEVDEETHSEEWYQEKEDALKENPKELILWAAENNRVSAIKQGLHLTRAWNNCFKVSPCWSLFLFV